MSKLNSQEEAILLLSRMISIKNLDIVLCKAVTAYFEYAECLIRKGICTTDELYDEPKMKLHRAVVQRIFPKAGFKLDPSDQEQLEKEISEVEEGWKRLSVQLSGHKAELKLLLKENPLTPNLANWDEFLKMSNN